MITPVSALSPSQLSATKPDEINQLSERLNSLTASVGHMLALQTQQHMNNITSNLSQGQGAFPTRQGPLELPPNQTISPPVSQSSIPNQGLSSRPDYRSNPRIAHPPLRTWSTGNLEIPTRTSDATVIRQDNSTRDKRKSVAHVVRRDSSGVRDFPPQSSFINL